MANDRIDTMLASNHEQQPELMLSNVLHLMSHYHANAACPKLASVIERHLRVLSSLPSLAPVLQAMGQNTYDFGEQPGAANVVKLCGNFLIGAAMEAMGEAFALAEKHGVSRDDVAAFLADTVFAAPVYRNYAPIIAAGKAKEVGFYLRLGLKDFNLVVDAAQRSQTPMPFADIVRGRLLSAMAKGRGEWDWTSLALGAAEDAGLKPAGSR